jgi:MEMO1 family protein
MSRDPEYMPRLRNVEPVAVEVEGRRAVALRDPLQLSENMLVVDREALALMSLFDGKHSLRDIQEALTRQAGALVVLDQIVAIVDKLDEVFLLEGPTYDEAYRRKVVQYRESPYRPSSHAGLSYNADSEGLRQELEGYFTGTDGPGLPDFFSDSRRPVGLIAPHIDVRSGGVCFAKAYQALASGTPSDVYVILGTGHSGVRNMFTATNLSFQTPLGIAETDRQFVEALSEELGRDAAAEELLHATEHVIEFQVIFLQYILSGRRNFKIVPVLCSLSHEFFHDANGFKEERRTFKEFCAALGKVVQQDSRKVCFIASADLDHIGPRYGDTFIPNNGTVSQALEEDRKLIRFLEQMDLEGFIRGVARENDARRICGFSPITTMMSTMEASEGRLLALDHTNVDDQNSFVSFTSMVFH